jgi:hypothetical protein
MKGYPKYIATRQDFINLLQDPEYRSRALADLRAISDLADDTASRSIGLNADGTDAIETIPNPMPLWRIKGFSSRQAVADLIAEYGGEV